MLDDRSLQIIESLLQMSIVFKQDLMSQFGLTKRQLDYSFDKINDWIKANNQLPIRFINDQAFVDRDTYTFLIKVINNGEEQAISDYILSNQERKNYIYLLLFIYEDYLSADHFVDSLEVSKTTFFKDLNEVKETLKDHKIQIVYDRKMGYSLLGEEHDFRNKMLQIVLYYLNVESNKKFLDYFIKQENLLEFQSTLHVILDLSEQLKVKFVENRLIEFVYSFIFLKERFQVVSIGDSKKIKDLELTEEYTFAKAILDTFRISSVNANYLTSLLLGFSAGVRNSSMNNTTVITLVDRLVERFQSISGTEINDKSIMKKQLYSHFLPVYYRLLFHLPVVNPLKEQIKREYNELYLIVSASLKSVENYFSVKIPDDEIAFITTHFASILSNFNDTDVNKSIAIIVCPNGIGSSMLLYSQLKSLFPDIKFLEPLDNMDAEMIIDQVDLIFTTTSRSHYLKKDKPIFIVNPILSKEDISKLQQEVYSVLRDSTIKYPSYKRIMQIVKEHVPDKYISDIAWALSNEFDLEQQRGNKIEKDLLQLSDLLKGDYISRNVSAFNKWDAVEKAALPLIENKAINDKYLGKIMESLAINSSYTVIAKGIAMPHAKPDNDVHKTCMSLISLKEPVLFGNADNDPVRYIFCLAIKDSDSHLKAMSTFVQLISNSEFFKVVDHTSDKEDIIQFIEEFEHY